MLQKENIKTLYKRIVKLGNYKPSKKVNLLFSKLVKESLILDDKKSLKTKELTNLQRICSLSEYELESYWANKIVKSKSPSNILKKFPYFSNYVKLTKMELYSLVSSSEHKNHSILFIGGGPLPLTSIILATNHDKRITILEKDINAFNISKKVIGKLNLSKMINIVNVDATYFDSYHKYNVIVVAALAGISKNSKELILRKIKENSSKETHILARSSWGSRKILYKPIDKKLFKLFKTEIEVRPHNDVVNSVIIFKT